MKVTKTVLFCLPIMSWCALAQTQAPIESETANSRERGAITISATGGWTFGLPSVRAAVSVPGYGNAISPLKKTLAAPGLGVSIRAWRFLVPFADFAVVDTGKAYAQVGPFRSDGQADTFAVHGGMRFIGGTSRLRPYAELGGGVLHQSLKATFTAAGHSTAQTASASLGSLKYGGGIQVFASRHFGADIGFDGFRVRRPMNGAGQNYSRVHLGVFYQTKSAIR